MIKTLLRLSARKILLLNISILFIFCGVIAQPVLTLNQSVAATGIVYSGLARVSDVPYPPLTATVSQTNITCNGANNGTATATASGGAGSYEYNWSPSGGSLATATGLAPGIYVCTITDFDFNITSVTVTIYEPVQLAASRVVNLVSCHGGNDGGITYHVTGGTTPYTYSWTPNVSTTNSITNVPAGTYTCVITDPFGCDLTKTYTITEPTAIAVSKVISLISCHGSGDGSIQYNVNGGTAPYTYSWTPNISSSNAASGLSAGTYTCVITDDLGCSVTKTQTFTEPSVLSATSSQINVSCNGGSDGTASVTMSGGSAPYSYSWSPSGGTDSAATGLTAGNYTCTVTDDHFCTFTASFNISQPVPVTISILTNPVNTTVDKGHDTIFSISASGAAGFQWQADAGSGYSDITDGSVYSGTQTNTLHITSAPGAFNGYFFRCKALAACAVPAVSTGARLNVDTRDTQTITFNPIDSIEYGGIPLTTGAYSSSGLTLAFASTDNSIISMSGGLMVIHKVGSVTITASQPGDGDYKPATSVSQTVVVMKKMITAQISSSPQITKVYDGNATATLSAQNYSLPDLVGSDHVTVSGTATYDNSNAGDGKDVTVTGLVLAGADKNNYILSSTTDITVGDISPRNITVAFNSSPVISRPYDGTTEAVLSGLNYTVSGNIGSEDVTVAVLATYNNKHAGTGKTVSAVNILGGADAGNYQLGNVTETTTGIITPLSVQVTADEQTKVFGSPDPQFTYTVTGLIGGDELSGDLDRSAGRNVGVYPITAGSLNGQGDYVISSFTGAHLSIAPAALSIIADNQTKKQGESNPTLSVQYTGFVDGDDYTDLGTAPSVSTPAVKNSPMGTYDISASGAVSANYNITYQKGTLSVMPSEEHMVSAWKSNSITMEVRVYSDRVQNATVQLRGNAGQLLTGKAVHLVRGVNKITLPAGGLASGAYIVAVGADHFRQTIQIWVRP